MISKFLEIRDAATFIPVFAFQMHGESFAERYLIGRAGFGKTDEEHHKYIVLWDLNGGYGIATSDAFRWTHSRTLGVAHRYIKKYWNEIHSGDVIDVEFILNETTEKKESERQLQFEPNSGVTHYVER